MRIFIGLKEIANIVSTYSRGFQTLGYKTYTVIWRRNPFFPNEKYDVVIDECFGSPSQVLNNPNFGFLKKALYLIRRQVFALIQFIHALLTCDIFIFIWGTSFLPKYWDYPILRLFRKKIVSVFCGTDIRYWYAFEQEMRLLGREEEVKALLMHLKGLAYSQPIPKVPQWFRPYIDFFYDRPDDLFLMKMTTVRAAEKYADLILSRPNMGQLQSRPYMSQNIPLDLSQYEFHMPRRKRPLILHAPSSRGTKGTEYVLNAIQQLKQDGLSFEFRLIENLNNAEVRQLLKKSDIAIDQLLIGNVGTFALEALATGNVVLSRYLSDYEHIPSDFPILNVTTYSLADRLREVIHDHDLRRKLSFAGRNYVEKNHDHLCIVQQILDWLRVKDIRNYDFKPVFYRNNFVMSSNLLKEERKMAWEQEKQLYISFISSIKEGLTNAARQLYSRKAKK